MNGGNGTKILVRSHLDRSNILGKKQNA